ncbi:hypothetical protein ELBI_42 [Anabaena phage Elbi]|nr:hypothetical protein ELBI_42 [Anabaena phage Elbi]
MKPYYVILGGTRKRIVEWESDGKHFYVIQRGSVLRERWSVYHPLVKEFWDKNNNCLESL